MAGHSKWSKIKRKKAVNDNKRGQVFTRLLKEIQVAAKMGGGDLDGNARLKRAVETAKSQGVPSDNIDKAIKRGTGDLEGVEYEEITYEAYGPAGVGLIIKTLTDNKTRTVGEVRHALAKNGGNLASSNAVVYQFSEKSAFTLPKELGDEDSLMEVLLEVGGDDLQDADDVWEVYAGVGDFDAVYAALQNLGEGVSGEIKLIPQNTVMLSGDDAEKMLKLMDALDDLDDVQEIASNFDLDEQA